jgi:lysophospholipid acyltransferase (LPLAT)-like uncharacterized protein
MSQWFRDARRNFTRRLGKRLSGRPWLQDVVGALIVGYYRFVLATSRKLPVDAEEFGRFEAATPVVLALWHGEALMVPFPIAVRWPMRAMTSRSRDGGVIAYVLRAVGIEPIRASGGRAGLTGETVSKRGGVAGLIQARDALRAGEIVCMTADVPKGVAYRVGPGIVALARLSGRPIMPVAAVTSRHLRLKTWDRLTIALPFGRIAVRLGEPVTVAADADDAAQEAARQRVEAELNRVHIAAYAAVGVRHG